MTKRYANALLPSCLLVALLPGMGSAQSLNARISGTVTDPTNAVVPKAELSLTGMATGVMTKVTSGPDGLFSFPNLQPGAYSLKASAQGFRDFLQIGITLNVNEKVRVDVKLQVGSALQRVEVTANVSPLNRENAEHRETITPDVLKALPLEVAGGIRSAGGFTVLMPGVSAPIDGGAFDGRINGGQQSGDEAIVDGVSLQEGLMSSSGATAVSDFPLSPDMVSEVTVLTSNYEPQYGSTTSGQIILETKSGTNQFHGTFFEFHRNTALNTRQFGVDQRPKDLEHEFGGALGGPFFIPHLWPKSQRTFFYLNMEGYRSAGGVSVPIFSVPTMAERQGDFRDWVDPNGNLIPIYDPDTLRSNPNYNPNLDQGPGNLPFLRNQFMGCDGKTPNVICPSDARLQDSLAQQWFQFLPPPNRPGVLNNFVVSKPQGNIFFFHTNLLDLRVDQYIREKDHVWASIYYHGSAPNTNPLAFPPQIDTSSYAQVEYGFVDRINWDHTITPSLLNHAAFGYLNQQEGIGSLDAKYANLLPQIPGVPSHAYPPAITLQGYVPGGCCFTFGDDNGIGTQSITGRPAAIANDLLTWVRGKHTLKFGGEYRWLAENNRTHYLESGDLTFAPGETGLRGIQSGNSVASFLLGEVDSAYVTVRNGYYANYPRQHAWIWHVGDTWRATPKLSLNYGIRWDMFTPSDDKRDVTSFFDPLGANPGAGGRPGRLAFAGTKWGAASFGRRHPERDWHRGYAPRLGIAYTLAPKTVVRTGYGIFYTQAFYAGWGGGIAQDGFSATPYFSSPDNGLSPAFLLRKSLVAQGIGFPQNFARPPFIDSTYLNGQGGPNYRPLDANRLPYGQQWNLTIEHQFTNDFYVSTAYVGSKGTRLASQVNPLNVLDPKLNQKYGAQLFDTFTPGSGQTSLDGVPIPYAGWIEQMSACPPTVAQALLPYPQYCDSLYGLNENDGNSTYHSFQLKAEKRFSHGLWMLTSYTVSKTLDDADQVQAIALRATLQHGVISRYEQHRNKALALDDVPQILSIATVYDLPIGAGKRWAASRGVLDRLVGGWSVSSIVRFSSGIPFFFRSSNCNVPGQFAVACIPAQLPGRYPFAVAKSNFNPEYASPNPETLFNINAFEPNSAFNSSLYYGQGPRVSNLRGFGYRNQDLALTKSIRITEHVALQLRGEAFNLWNWHSLASDGSFFVPSAFDTDVASPTFGRWNGAVTAPRNIQVAARITF